MLSWTFHSYVFVWVEVRAQRIVSDLDARTFPLFAASIFRAENMEAVNSLILGSWNTRTGDDDGNVSETIKLIAEDKRSTWICEIDMIPALPSPSKFAEAPYMEAVNSLILWDSLGRGVQRLLGVGEPLVQRALVALQVRHLFVELADRVVLAPQVHLGLSQTLETTEQYNITQQHNRTIQCNTLQ